MNEDKRNACNCAVSGPTLGTGEEAGRKAGLDAPLL